MSGRMVVDERYKVLAKGRKILKNLFYSQILLCLLGFGLHSFMYQNSLSSYFSPEIGLGLTTAILLLIIMGDYGMRKNSVAILQAYLLFGHLFSVILIGIAIFSVLDIRNKNVRNPKEQYALIDIVLNTINGILFLLEGYLSHKQRDALLNKSKKQT